MKKFSILLCLLFAALFGYSQCDLSVVDTTHIECGGESTGGFVIDVSNAVSPYVLVLNNGVSQIDNPVFSNMTAGDYEVSITDANGCSDVISVRLKEPPLLSMSLKCEGVRLLSEVSGGVKDYTYTWSDAEGQIFSTDTVVDYIPNVLYAFEVVDAKGCSRKDTIHVWANFEVDRFLGEIPFDVYVFNKSSQGLYEWDFGSVGDAYSFEPSYTFDEVGEYEIVLTVEDESSSCVATYSVFVDAQGFEMKGENDWAEMYDVISPNGDGSNDAFSFLENHAIVSFEASIYNRWGARVYKWTDPSLAWAGVNSKGSLVSEGVYFYVMKAVGEDGALYEKKGVVSVFF